MKNKSKYFTAASVLRALHFATKPYGSIHGFYGLTAYELAHHVKWSRRHVQRTLDLLERAGMVEYSPRTDVNARPAIEWRTTERGSDIACDCDLSVSAIIIKASETCNRWDDVAAMLDELDE